MSDPQRELPALRSLLLWHRIDPGQRTHLRADRITLISEPPIMPRLRQLKNKLAELCEIHFFDRPVLDFRQTVNLEVVLSEQS